jgi:hypothetical protein
MKTAVSLCRAAQPPSNPNFLKDTIMVHPNSVNATEIPIGVVPMFTSCKFHQLCGSETQSDCRKLCGMQDYLNFTLIHVGGKSYIKLLVTSFSEDQSANAGKFALFQLSQVDYLIEILEGAKNHG